MLSEEMFPEFEFWALLIEEKLSSWVGKGRNERKSQELKASSQVSHPWHGSESGDPF